MLDSGWGVATLDFSDGAVVNPGDSYTFTFNPQAPIPPGQFGGFLQLEFQMTHGASRFGDATSDGVQQWVAGCGG